MKTVLSLVILVLMFVSCKNQSKENQEEDKPIIMELPANTHETVQKVDNFTIEINAQVEKQDKFQVFYVQKEGDRHEEKNSVWVNINPKKEYQKIVFELPKEVFPKNIRLDLGTNKEMFALKIKNIALKYKEYNSKIEGKELLDYFVLNKGVTIENDSLTYRLSSFNIGEIEKYDPYIVGKKELENLIKEELKEID